MVGCSKWTLERSMDGPVDGMVDKKCRAVVNGGAVALSNG